MKRLVGLDREEDAELRTRLEGDVEVLERARELTSRSLEILAGRRWHRALLAHRAALEEWATGRGAHAAAIASARALAVSRGLSTRHPLCVLASEVETRDEAALLVLRHRLGRAAGRAHLEEVAELAGRPPQRDRAFGGALATAFLVICAALTGVGLHRARTLTSLTPRLEAAQDASPEERQRHLEGLEPPPATPRSETELDALAQFRQLKSAVEHEAYQRDRLNHVARTCLSGDFTGARAALALARNDTTSQDFRLFLAGRIEAGELGSLERCRELFKSEAGTWEPWRACRERLGGRP